jgi:hypothetical protein
MYKKEITRSGKKLPKRLNLKFKNPYFTMPEVWPGFCLFKG